MTIHKCPKCGKLTDCHLDFCGDPIETKCEDCSVLCYLTSEELEGLKRAEGSKKSNAVSSWKYAIAEKYNLNTVRFTMDKKGGLHLND